MLQLALKAQLPLVAVSTRDVLNLPDVIKELTGKRPVTFAPNGPWASNTVYLHHCPPGDKPLGPALGAMYERMTKAESTLVLINPPGVQEPMFDAGEVPVPKSLLVKFLKAVVDSDKKAEELIRALGGCTIKESAELCRLTMARDKSLTSDGLMATRKQSFQGQKGLYQVDVRQPFYAPPEQLVEWALLEKPYFLTGEDNRMMPRGLLLDGPPGVGKTAAAKWLAQQFGVPLYRVDIGGAKGKYMGQSEQALLANLARLDQDAPAVALIDEVEKVFSVGDHDTTGTTTTMLSQLLWWLAEHKSRVLTIMTTNNAKKLPPELHREGRIDKTMLFTGLHPGQESATFVRSVLHTFGVKTPLNSMVGSIVEAAAKASDPAYKTISQAALTEAVKRHLKLSGKSS